MLSRHTIYCTKCCEKPYPQVSPICADQRHMVAPTLPVPSSVVASLPEKIFQLNPEVFWGPAPQKWTNRPTTLLGEVRVPWPLPWHLWLCPELTEPSGRLMPWLSSLFKMKSGGCKIFKDRTMNLATVTPANNFIENQDQVHWLNKRYVGDL